jgi:hypothetical protein
MPNPCYSYVPSDSTSRDASQDARRGLRKMPYPCYSYPAICFSYPDDALWGTPRSDATPSVPPGLRGMTFGTCFRY